MTDPADVTKLSVSMDTNELNQQETNIAVNSILEQVNNSNSVKLNDEVNKRKRETTEHNSPTETNTHSTKKQFFKRYYNENNKGPFEVIIQDKEKRKLNPFFVGKIIKHHFDDIEFIDRAGKNLSVICKHYLAANNLVDSQHLSNYNVFVPSIRIHSVGVAYVEPDVTEEEILNETISQCPILQVQRIKKRVNNELMSTHFVKITFNSDFLPEFITLNYVRIRIDTYFIPVKQCYRCFAYGHVASTPCNKVRLCRNCGGDFHTGDCVNPVKCVNCFAAHSSNSKACPEYIRQKNIKDRMSLQKEDYHTASKFFPIQYKKQWGDRYKTPTYAQASSSKHYSKEFPELPSPIYNSQTSLSNRFSPLSEINDSGKTFTAPISYNTKPRIPHNTVNSDKTKNYNKMINPSTAKHLISETTHRPRLLLQDNIPDKEHLNDLIRKKMEQLRSKLNTNNQKDLDEIITIYKSVNNHNDRSSNVRAPTSKINTNKNNKLQIKRT